MKHDIVPIGITDGELIGTKVRLLNNLELDFNGHNPCIGIELKERNKISANSIEKAGVGYISINGTRIYTFEFDDISNGLWVALYKLAILRILPFDLDNPDLSDDIIGRRIKHPDLGPDAMVVRYEKTTGALEIGIPSGLGPTIITDILDRDISW